jgi:predicted transcriptional regulator YdeE
MVGGGVIMSVATEQVKIVEFGPYRAIGMSYRGKNENGEIPDLWAREGGFMQRMHEVDAQPGVGMFGLCRCIAGVQDGSWEYIAAAPAQSDSPIPEGMIEANVPAATYAVFTVPNLAGIGQAWTATQEWMAAHLEYKSYCEPTETGCGCIDHPNFELYPPGFNGENQLFIYVPVRKS